MTIFCIVFCFLVHVFQYSYLEFLYLHSNLRIICYIAYRPKLHKIHIFDACFGSLYFLSFFPIFVSLLNFFSVFFFYIILLKAKSGKRVCHLYQRIANCFFLTETEVFSLNAYDTYLPLEWIIPLSFFTYFQARIKYKIVLINLERKGSYHF